MNWKLKTLFVLALVASAAVFLGLPSQAQNLKSLFASETVDNASQITQIPASVTRSSDSPAAIFSYTGPAVAVPDNNTTGVNIVLPVSGSGNITDLDFVFDTGGACDATVGNANAAVDHSFVGDLIFKLTSPTGQVATFMAARGGTRENICQTTINDDGGDPNVSTLTSVTGQFVGGNFTPELTGPLSVFDGNNANGNWTLNVVDNASLDTGSVRRFSLNITAGAPVPALTINDVAVTEGNSGTTNATFTVSLNPAAAVPVSVNYATADQTATAPSDYTTSTGTVTFAAGETSKAVTVPVIGDATFEPNETFAVNLTAPTGGAAITDAQGIGTINNDDASPLPLCQFNNGGINPQPLAKNGTAAPAGKFWSEAQNDTGNTAVANTNAGLAALQGTTRLADNFTVPAGGCFINTVTFFAYQTGSPATPSPFAATTLQIWNGRPGDVGATVVFGDTTTNRLASSVDTNVFRIFNTIAPPPGTATGTTRVIWRNTVNVGAALSTPGTYWLDWASTATNAGAHFYPSKTIEGARGAVGDNARQQTVSTGAWVDVLDAGNPATPPSVNQDLPFFLNTLAAPSTPRADFDGDGKTDLSVFRPSEGVWYQQRSGGANVGVQWGVSSDTIMPGDFDGDNKADLGVFRPSNTAGVTDCFVLRSSTNTAAGFDWGNTSDLPVIADYDGDSKDDVAMYRPSTNDYFVILSTTGGTRHFRWGISGDLPVPGDFDGDGKAEFATFRPSNGTWYYTNSTGGAFVAVQYGASGDIPVFADYDGDAKDDIAVFRPSNGTWYLNRSTAGSIAVPFGATDDVPVPGDYDGDGKYDTAVYRAGVWYLNQSTSGIVGRTFGLTTDRAVPRSYLP